MKTFAYKVRQIAFNDQAELNEWLNEQGLQGWDIVTINITPAPQEDAVGRLSVLVVLKAE